MGLDPILERRGTGWKVDRYCNKRDAIKVWIRIIDQNWIAKIMRFAARQAQTLCHPTCSHKSIAEVELVDNPIL